MGEGVSLEQMERDLSAEGAPELPEGFEFVSAGEAPGAAMAAIAAAGLEQTPSDDIPLIDAPGQDEWPMPGGIVIDGNVFRKARVRELNGEDEEFLARALAAQDFNRYQQVLLERGVTHLGSTEATPELLDRLIVGDRDALILGVRIATYGETLDMDVMCQHCGVDSKIRVDFTVDVPMKPLAFSIEEPEQQVELSKGSWAMVRLANGADVRYLSGLENKTVAEANTELLTRCVKEINGNRDVTKQVIRSLSMRDRTALVNWMADNQPGPEYDKVKHTCVVCGKETPLELSTGDLFRG